MQLVLKRKKNPNVTEENRWYIRNAKKEKKPYTQYGHLAPSVPNNKGVFLLNFTRSYF